VNVAGMGAETFVSRGGESLPDDPLGRGDLMLPQVPVVPCLASEDKPYFVGRFRVSKSKLMDKHFCRGMHLQMIVYHKTGLEILNIIPSW